jgi:beta-lactamase regulating signal transducer with metallopeptidase domain
MSLPALPFMVAIAVKVTIVFGLVMALDLTVLRRHASAAMRHLLWTVAVIAALVLPVLNTALPEMRLPILRPDAVRTPSLAYTIPRPEIAPAVPAAARGFDLPPLATRPADDRVAAIPRDSSTRWSLGGLALVIYAVGVLVLLFRVGFDHLAVRRVALAGTSTMDENWTALLARLAQRSGVRGPVTLVQSRAPIMPLTAGIVHPVVVVPQVADEWSVDRREAVLLHELAHVARHDCLTQTLAAIACAVYWPHPLAWWAAARLRLERELACDDRVLMRGYPSRDYASHLLVIARTLSTTLPRLAVSMAVPSQLEDRLRAVIDDSRRRSAPGSRQAMLTGLIAAALVALIAAAHPVRLEAAPTPSVSPPAPSSPASTMPTHTPTIREGQTVRQTAPAQRREPSASQRAESGSPIAGEFRIRRATLEDGPGNAGLVHVMLRTPGMNTFYTAMAKLEGLDETVFTMREAALHFRVKRDAGDFEFIGTMRNGRGEGRFEYAPNPGFNPELRRRRIDSLVDHQQFSLARHDLGLAFIDELAKQGYAIPTPDELVRASVSSVDLDYLREMNALGYRERTLEALVRLSNMGIGPDFVRAFASAGYSRLTADELNWLASQGIDGTFANNANARAGRTLSVPQLVQAADEMRKVAEQRPERSRSRAPAVSVETAPDSSPPLVDDTVVDGKWWIRVRPDGWLQLDIDWSNVNQWKRFVRPTELLGITAATITAASGPTPAKFHIDQDAGIFEFEGTFDRGRGEGSFLFKPNLDFPAMLRALGVREVDRVGIHQLKNLAFAPMSAADVQELMRIGLSPPLTLRHVVDLAVYRVTPTYLRALKSLGIRGIDSVRAVIEAKVFGLPVPYASDIVAVGFTSLTYRQLIEMYRAGITPAFIRQQQVALGRDLTPEELISLRHRR